MNRTSICVLGGRGAMPRRDGCCAFGLRLSPSLSASRCDLRFESYLGFFLHGQPSYHFHSPHCFLSIFLFWCNHQPNDLFLFNASHRHTLENHAGIGRMSGFTSVREYRYWDDKTRGIDMEGMLADLKVPISPLPTPFDPRLNYLLLFHNLFIG